MGSKGSKKVKINDHKAKEVEENLPKVAEIEKLPESSKPTKNVQSDW